MVPRVGAGNGGGDDRRALYRRSDGRCALIITTDGTKVSVGLMLEAVATMFGERVRVQQRTSASAACQMK
jgi:hypothetical protein